MEHAREDLMELAGGDRGGVVQGYTPVHSHVQLYLVQIILIVVLCFVLGQIVKKWNQPRVIAEVGASLADELPYVPTLHVKRCCCGVVSVALLLLLLYVTRSSWNTGDFKKIQRISASPGALVFVWVRRGSPVNAWL